MNVELLTAYVREVQKVMDCGTDVALAQILKSLFIKGYEAGKSGVELQIMEKK